MHIIIETCNISLSVTLLINIRHLQYRKFLDEISGDMKLVFVIGYTIANILLSYIMKLDYKS